MSLGYEISKEIIEENSVFGYINEISFYRDSKYEVAVDNSKTGSYGFGSSYFKYYFVRKTKNYVARLLLCKAEFTSAEHDNSYRTTRGGRHINLKNAKYLNSEESDILINILQSSCTNKYYIDLGATTIYSALIINSNEYAGVSKSDMDKYKDYSPDKCPRPILPYNCQIPDYRNIK